MRRSKQKRVVSGAGMDPTTGRLAGAVGNARVAESSAGAIRRSRNCGGALEDERKSANSADGSQSEAVVSDADRVSRYGLFQKGAWLVSREVSLVTLQACFPDQFERLMAKHAGDTDKNWVSMEMNNLYQCHYSCRRLSQGYEKRTRLLTGCLRGFLRFTEDKFENFFALNPTLSEIRAVIDPVSKKFLHNLMALLSQRWLDLVFERIVLTSFDGREVKGSQGDLFDWAILCNQVDRVRELLVSGKYEATRKGCFGQKDKTPLNVALDGEDASNMVRVLVEAGADQHADIAGWTAFHVAAMDGHVGVVRVLLELGADLHRGDTYSGDTALHIAAGNGRTEVVRALVDLGADVRRLNTCGQTALSIAQGGGFLGVISVLTNGQTIPSKPVKKVLSCDEKRLGRTLFRVDDSLLSPYGSVHASRSYDTERTSERHSEPVEPTEKALFTAIKNRNKTQVSSLLVAGVSAGAINDIGQTALEAARKAGDRSIILKIQAALALDEAEHSAMNCRMM